MSRLACVLLVLCCACASGCASRPAKSDPRDPFERINRTTFAFNESVDRHIAKPIAQTYRKITPHFVQTGVSNFLENLGYPVVLVNDLLQAKFKATLNDMGRLLLNTTLGLGGLLDPASDAGLDKNDEDFGQTFGRWGVHPGPYLMLPLLGPSDIRDGVGKFADTYADPRHYIQNSTVRWGLWAVDALDTRARLLDTEKVMDGVYDRYAFIRNAYLQRRQYQVKDGQVTDESADEGIAGR